MSENLVVQSAPEKLLELAVNKNIEIEKLEKLMAMVQEHNRIEAAKAFKGAMVQFQGSKPKLVKDRDVKFDGKLRYKFATLSSIQEKVDPILSEYGLSYSWETEQTDTIIKVTCIVSHVDGHIEKNTLSAPQDGSGSKNAIQSIGSTVSYLKRYTLEGVLGLSSDIDNDGNVPDIKEKIDPKLYKKLIDGAVKKMESCKTMKDLQGVYTGLSKDLQADKEIVEVKNKLKKKISMP